MASPRATRTPASLPLPGILLIALLLVPFAPGPASADHGPQEGHCPDKVHVEDLGPACRTGSGLWRVFLDDGRTMTTHGVDSFAAEPETAAGHMPTGEDPPVCIESTASTYYHHVIYARAHDKADGYAANVDMIRTTVDRANFILNDEAVREDHRAEYRMLCSGGTVVVENEVLPTDRATTTFTTIVSDLRALGYDDDPHAKYWVWYDDASSGCRGTGHIYDDDRASIDNHNNGAPGTSALFGVTWGCTGDGAVRVMMHENAHNMGAVQRSAPHATDRFHCNDGLDIMCYDDGASDSAYDDTVCPDRMWFDCNHDDYFDPVPASGSYLDAHWNVGHTRNRFLVIEALNDAPVMTSLSCSPSTAETHEAVTCSFAADDTTSSGVHYDVDWGDGTAVRVPATGTVTPGTTQSADHAYTDSGTFTVTVTATDDGDPPLSSDPVTTTVDVFVPANARPVMEALSCTAGKKDETTTCSFMASDDSDGLHYTVDWGDGTTTTRVPSTGTVAPGTTQQASHVYTAEGTFTVSVTATDTGGRTSDPRTASISITGPACILDRSGALLAGLPVGTVSGVNTAWEPVPQECLGSFFELRANKPAHDFDVCWYRGDGSQIRCDTNLGIDRGFIPSGATDAQVLFRLGTQATYRLFTF